MALHIAKKATFFKTTGYNYSTMKIKNANVTINVKDLDIAVSFYESIGLTVKSRWGDHYAQLSAPGIVIGLHPTDNDNLSGGSGNVSIGFATEELEEVKSALQKLSIKSLERREEGGKFLHFSDPDGTALYFIELPGK